MAEPIPLTVSVLLGSLDLDENEVGRLFSEAAIRAIRERRARDAAIWAEGYRAPDDSGNPYDGGAYPSDKSYPRGNWDPGQ